MIEEVSVVIPSYNASIWLPKSIPFTDRALTKSGVKNAEIIVIDDGSSDDTEEVVKKINTKNKLRYYKFENGGRFLARKRGTDLARYNHILFIDTRIYINSGSLKFVVESQKKQPNRNVWTSHVHLDRNGNMFARFWEAITFLAWRKYFSNPRDLSYGIKDFDSYPKGTTCFFAPKEVIEDANAWFENNTNDIKTSNDDTLLIRRIAEENLININPKFSCIYHARTNLKQFVKHTHHRGKVFVDGFFRRDGNKFFYVILLFLIASVLTPLILIAYTNLLIYAVSILALLWALIPVTMLVVGVYWKDSLSFLMLSPVFLISYGLGIWRAFFELHIKPALIKK